MLEDKKIELEKIKLKEDFFKGIDTFIKFDENEKIKNFGLCEVKSFSEIINLQEVKDILEDLKNDWETDFFKNNNLEKNLADKYSKSFFETISEFKNEILSLDYQEEETNKKRFDNYFGELNNKSKNLEKDINEIELKLSKMQEKIIERIEQVDLLYDEKNDCYELDNSNFKNLTEFLEAKEYFNKNIVEDFIKEEFTDLLSDENSLNDIKKIAYDKMVEVTDDIKKLINEDYKGEFIFYNSYDNLQEKYEKRTIEFEEKLEELEKEKQKDEVSFEMESFIL